MSPTCGTPSDRRITAVLFTSNFITLDGVIGDPQIWHPAYASEESVTMLAEQIDADDTAMVIGRATYDGFVSYWPDQDDTVPMARRTNEIKKWVVTSDPAPLGWNNSSIVEGEPMDGIRRLKGQGGDLFVPGSATLVAGLLAAGLVDEMRFYLDPFIYGHGRRLLDEGVPATAFELVDERALPHGVRYLAYRVDAAARG